MNSDGDLTPTPQPDPGEGVPPVAPVVSPVAPRSWLARHRRLLIPAAGMVALASVSAAAALLLVKPNASVEKMVPATADVVAVANVDPSVTQKVNLLRAVHSFPDYKTDKAITDKIDQAFKGSGFSFTGDIQPWLGSEIGVSARLSFTNIDQSPVAFYAVSRDDTKALASLAKLRASTWGKKFQWKDETYNGITISVGTPKAATEKANAYSYVDHVVVIATSAAMIHEIIDADQGRAPRVVDSADFKATLAGLPSDRVGFAYINGKSLIADTKKEMAKTPALGLALKNMNDVDALQGIGATLSANGNGLLTDVAVRFDESKLSPATRTALAHAGHADGVVRWIPKASDAFLAVTGINKTMQSVLDQAGSDASVKAGTDAMGLTGSGGVLAHLTGDAGLEVEFGQTGLPAGAILMGTDDAKVMNAFFAKLLLLAEGAVNSGLSGSGSTFGSSNGAGSGTSAFVGTTTKATYRGVVITSWTSPELNALGSFAPSYAVLDGMGILASSPAEVKAIIDTHKGGATIASDTTYKTASAASLGNASAIVYLDVAKLVADIRKSPFGSQAGLGTGSTVSANLDPVQAFILTAASQSGQALERFFLLIK